MNVETIAVAEVNGLVGMCPHLVPLITTNDRTPFTDGHIDVYSSLSHSNKNWSGRVPVQVKGRTVSRSGRALKSYPVSRTDLLAFQSDSGVLYLVVSISPDTGEKRSFYSLLSPFAIQALLEKASPKTRTISVPLKEFPTSPSDIERLVWVALKTRDQRPSIGDVSSLIPQMKSLTIYSAQDLNFDLPISLSPGDTDHALVLNTSSGMSLPLGGTMMIYPPSYTPRTADVTVECGGIAFDQPLVRQVSSTEVELKMSEGLTLVIQLGVGMRSIQAAFTLTDSFIDRLKVLEFHEALRSQHPLTIDGHATQIEVAEPDDSSRRRHLHYLRALNELFTKLGIDPQLIRWDEITNAQHEQLWNLYRSLVKGDEFLDDDGEVSRFLQQVGRWQIMLLLLPGAESGYWRYANPFDPEERAQVQVGRREVGKEAVEYVPGTIYDLMAQEHVPTTVNLRLDQIIDAYEVIADLPDTASIANLRVLSLISAADAGKEREWEFLDAACRLNEWLIENEPESPHHLVNRWQILWRLGELTPEHRSEIRHLRRVIARTNEPSDPRIAYACSLLLGDDEEARDLFGQLTREAQDQMTEWPLWRLRNHSMASLEATAPTSVPNRDLPTPGFLEDRGRQTTPSR